AYLREELDEIRAFGDIIGKSPALMNVLEQIQLVAPTGASVLILGESGSGKELVAREIHRRSERNDRPMIKVNCANIPRDLYESEFFGHVKGAFTGAFRDRAGRFEAAHGGTLFLDEVGEIPLDLQGKLLRVLQEGRYERVGEETTRQVDVRIIAATNRNLKQEVEGGKFRQDFYYRLNVFPIEVAPLRQRKDDIHLLATHFLMMVSGKMNRPVPPLGSSQLAALEAYPWPGNVRELQNVIERAVITSRSGRLHFDLPREPTPYFGNPSDSNPKQNRVPVSDREMKQREKENLVAALNQCKWKIYGPGGAAELLGIKPTTLISRIKKMGLQRPAKRIA
ncbi:sigma-54 interaction domain-containing protein, partial [Thermodesulfobacteriota bacterium]